MEESQLETVLFYSLGSFSFFLRERDWNIKKSKEKEKMRR